MKNITTTMLLMCMILLSTLTGLAQTQMSVRRIVHAGPPLQTLASSGTTHCAGTPGPNVYLTSSTTNTSYQLYQVVSMSPFTAMTVGSPVNGTGAIVNFGAMNDGTYFSVATSLTTSCKDTMVNYVTISSMAIPTVNITANGPTTGCGTVSVTLNTPYEMGCTYQWQEDMVNIPFATSTSYTATVNNTTKAYTCIATNSLGCSFSQTVVVKSNPLPTAFAVNTTTSSFCENSSGGVVNLASTATGVNYQLMNGATAIGAPVAGTNAAAQWSGLLTAGPYTVVATDQTTGCSATMNGSVSFIMNPLPVAASVISGPASACQNATVTYSTASITGATSYNWSVPSWTTIVSGQGTTQITLLVNTSGVSGNIFVCGHNTCGDGQSVSLALTVNDAPIVNVTANPADICAGGSTTLAANGNGTAFAWSGGGNTQSITASPAATTTYYVTVTGSNTCTATGNVTVNVHSLPAVSLTLTEDNFCMDVNSAVISGGLPAGGTYTGACVFGNNNIYPPVSGPGTWVVSYTFSDTYGCSAVATDLLTINPNPVVNFNNITGQINTDTPPFDLMNFVMPIGGTFTGPGCMPGSSMYNPSLAGGGTHMLTYTYEHPITGCSASQIQYVTVTGPANGVDETTAAHTITIYPNPASDNITFAGLDNIKDVIFMNMIGEVVYTTNVDNETMVINISDLPNGTYFVRFITTDGTPISSKFIKAN